MQSWHPQLSFPTHSQAGQRRRFPIFMVWPLGQTYSRVQQLSSWLCPGGDMYPTSVFISSRDSPCLASRFLNSSRSFLARIFWPHLLQTSRPSNKLTGANRRFASGFRLSFSSLIFSGCREPQALPAPIAQLCVRALISGIWFHLWTASCVVQLPAIGWQPDFVFCAGLSTRITGRGRTRRWIQRADLFRLFAHGVFLSSSRSRPWLSSAFGH